MSLNLTGTIGGIYNTIRGLILDRAATLTLLSYGQVAGESELAEVTSEWMIEQSTDNETSSMRVWIIERSGIDAALMNQVARFSITGTVYRVVPGGITPPFSEPRQWVLVGEEIREQL